MYDATGLSQRRACRLTDLSLSTCRYDAQRPAADAHLSGRITELAIDVPHDISAPDYIGDKTIARNILNLNQTGQRILKDLVEEHNITEAHMRHSCKYQAAVEDSGIAVLEAYRGGLEALGQKCKIIEGNELPDIFGTKFYRKALYTLGTILVQPSGLVKGLADTLPQNVTLYEETAITAIEYEPEIVLHHATGRIKAKKLILGNNAFGTHFGFGERTIFPVFTYGSLTRPLTKVEQDSIGGQDFWGIIPADPFGTTCRRTHDNGILIRNSFSFNENGRYKPGYTQKYRESHRLSFKRRFPTLKDVNFEHTWVGGLGMTRNGSSLFGELRKNVYGALGCNGLGTVRSTAMGTMLADWLASVMTLSTICFRCRNRSGTHPIRYLPWA